MDTRSAGAPGKIWLSDDATLARSALAYAAQSLANTAAGDLHRGDRPTAQINILGQQARAGAARGGRFAPLLEQVTDVVEMAMELRSHGVTWERCDDIEKKANEIYARLLKMDADMRWRPRRRTTAEKPV
ncbi:MAG: hypothetical protein HKM24_01780 [Gammaproteobacteria bacterium]|nr:hypothetical protein [Gammaproteobacteria bacterium]